jgi:hypothetical protein
MAHCDARVGKWRETGEWSGYPVPFTLPRNMMYPTLLPLTRTPRLRVVDRTDALADLNGLVPFAERRNLVSARVPSRFIWLLPPQWCVILVCQVTVYRILGWWRGRDVGSEPTCDKIWTIAGLQFKCNIYGILSFPIGCHMSLAIHNKSINNMLITQSVRMDRMSQTSLKKNDVEIVMPSASFIYTLSIYCTAW